jgi:hypothetical protein
MEEFREVDELYRLVLAGHVVRSALPRPTGMTRPSFSTAVPPILAICRLSGVTEGTLGPILGRLEQPLVVANGNGEARWAIIEEYLDICDRGGKVLRRTNGVVNLARGMMVGLEGVT